MKRVGITIKAALVTLSIAAMTPVFAQVQSSSSLHLGYELHDLDPSDGITPWITFNPREYNIDASALLPAASPSVSQVITTFGSVEAHDANAAASASASPTLWQSSVQAYQDSAVASINTLVLFGLSPYTSVTFFVDGGLWVGGAESGHALASVYMGSTVGSDIGYYGWDSVEIGTAGHSDDLDRAIDIHVTTSGRSHYEATMGWVSVQALVRADAVPAVPEPGVPTMLLGGLPLLAVAGRWHGRRGRH